MFVSPSQGFISIIIPTLNEEFGIGKTIQSIPKSAILKDTGYETEIIVVDGRSTDKTRDIALKMGAKVIIEKRQGYGRACKSGFAASKGKILVTIDADNTYPTQRIPSYVRTLVDGRFDFLSINRFSCMEKGAMNLRRRFGNKLLTLLIRLLYRLDIKDSQSGMWIMRNSFISQIKLISDDMSLSEEIKIIAFRNFRAAEVGGKYSARCGRAKLKEFRDGWKNMTFVLRYKRKIESAAPELSSASSSFSSSNKKEILSE